MKFLSEDFFDALPIRVVTKNMVVHLVLDLPLTPAECVDFGVDSDNHYRVLQTIVREAHCAVLGMPEETHAVAIAAFRDRVLELDAAYGNGAKLNALVQKYVPEYVELAQFHTSWDVIYDRDEATASGESRTGQ